jgi:hypothetical protein
MYLLLSKMLNHSFCVDKGNIMSRQNTRRDWSIAIITVMIMSNSSRHQVRAAHLLIKHSGSRNPVSRRTGMPVDLGSVDAVRELELYEERIRSEGLESFSRYAKERSDCGSYANGGDLGFFGPGMELLSGYSLGN